MKDILAGPKSTITRCVVWNELTIASKLHQMTYNISSRLKKIVKIYSCFFLQKDQINLLFPLLEKKKWNIYMYVKKISKKQKFGTKTIYPSWLDYKTWLRTKRFYLSTVYRLGKQRVLSIFTNERKNFIKIISFRNFKTISKSQNHTNYKAILEVVLAVKSQIL